MRVEQLEYFLHVASYGSLSLAASKIYVGQPTLSAAISSLEKELGKPLFRRTRRGMELTSFGQDILPLIEKTVDDYYDIKKKAGVNVPVNSHLHLSTTFFTYSILHEALTHTYSIFPEVSFSLQQQSINDVIRDVSENRATIGLSAALDYNLSRHREYASSLNLRLMPLYNDNLCLCVKGGGYFQSLIKMRLSALPNSVPLSVPRDLVETGSIKSQSPWSHLPKHLTFGSGEGLYQYVYRTDGIGITSYLGAQHHALFTSGLLKTITLSDSSVNLVHYLTYPKDQSLSDVEADIIQQIENYYEHLDI